MQVASSLAGFTLAQADLLRRAMSKKIPEVMEEQRKNFVTGCIKNGLSETVATKIFDLIDYFSGYGFNKSHSAAYAMISFRTAYLKANFPVEFMCALLTSERDNTDKIVEYVNEANRMGIKILPPDINESDALFKVIDQKTIRFGLLAVKNVGAGAIESIIEQRKKGKFKSLNELCNNIDLRLVNKKVLESLIKCGALDAFGVTRAQMVSNLDKFLDNANKKQKDRTKGQLSFFDGGFTNSGFIDSMDSLPAVREWPEPQVLAFEKEMLGFYISGHPLAHYASQLKRFTSSHTANLKQHKDDEEIKIVGLIEKIKNTVTRAKQEKMAILKLEDLEGAVEILVFPKTYSKVSRYLQQNSVVMVTGVLNLREETPKIIANDLFPMDEIYKQISNISINLSGIKENLFQSLKTLLEAHSGRVPVYLHLDTPTKTRVQMVVGDGLYITPSYKLIQEIVNILGEDKLSLTL